MRLCIVVCVSLLAAGCSPSTVRNGRPVTPQIVRNYMADQCQPSERYTAYDFLVAGVGAANEQCEIYLTQLMNVNRDSRFLTDLIATGNSQTAVVLNQVYSDPKIVVTVVAAATEFVRSIITGYAKEYAFSDFAREVYPKVKELMSAHLADPNTGAIIEQIRSAPRDSPAGYCMAADVVKTLASYCSPLYIDSSIRKAISSAPVNSAPPPSGQARSFSPSATRSFVPRSPVLSQPVYTLGSD